MLKMLNEMVNHRENNTGQTLTFCFGWDHIVQWFDLSFSVILISVKENILINIGEYFLGDTIGGCARSYVKIGQGCGMSTGRRE